MGEEEGGRGKKEISVVERLDVTHIAVQTIACAAECTHCGCRVCTCKGGLGTVIIDHRRSKNENKNKNKKRGKQKKKGIV